MNGTLPGGDGLPPTDAAEPLHDEQQLPAPNGETIAEFFEDLRAGIPQADLDKWTNAAMKDIEEEKDELGPLPVDTPSYPDEPSAVFDLIEAQQRIADLGQQLADAKSVNAEARRLNDRMCAERETLKRENAELRAENSKLRSLRNEFGIDVGTCAIWRTTPQRTPPMKYDLTVEGTKERLEHMTFRLWNDANVAATFECEVRAHAAGVAEERERRQSEWDTCHKRIAAKDEEIAGLRAEVELLTSKVNLLQGRIDSCKCDVPF